MRGRSLIASIMAGLMISSPTMANLNLNGAIIEMSSPQVIKGREMTTISGGGVRVRLQDQTIRPFSITPPNIRAGCGGIDATFGSFSFLNMEYLGQFLQNLLNPEAALVVGFQLALHVLCPSCEELLSKLNALANQINQIGVSKCGAIQLASTIGKTWIDSALGRTRDSSGRLQGEDSFMKFDKLYIQPASQTLQNISNAIDEWCPGGDCLLGLYLKLNPGERKSFITALLENGYIPQPVIQSLGGQNTAGDVMRAVLGDIVFWRPDNNTPPRAIDVPPVENMRVFIDAWIGKFNSGQGQGSGQGLNCAGSVSITSAPWTGSHVDPRTVQIQPLCNVVKPHIENIRRKIETRQPLSDDEKLLIASMPNSVLYLLNLASIEPGIRDAVFQNMLEYITAELASAFMQSAIRAQQRFASLCLSESKKGNDIKKLCEEQSRRSSELSQEIGNIRRFYYKQFQENTDAILKVIQLRNTLMSQIAVNTSIGGPLMYSQMLGGLR